MATAQPDAVCVAYDFHSSIVASIFFLYLTISQQNIYSKTAFLIICVSFDIMKTRMKRVKRVTLRVVRNCEFIAGTKYAASLKMPQ